MLQGTLVVVASPSAEQVVPPFVASVQDLLRIATPPPQLREQVEGAPQGPQVQSERAGVGQDPVLQERVSEDTRPNSEQVLPPYAPSKQLR